jgi:hypothetical protein
MKNFIILFSCLVLMQGCSSNKVQSEQDVQKNTINEIKSNMGAPGKPVEFGTTCSYISRESSSRCLTQMQLVGMSCSCMTNAGPQSGSVVK